MSAIALLFMPARFIHLSNLHKVIMRYLNHNVPAKSGMVSSLSSYCSKIMNAYLVASSMRLKSLRHNTKTKLSAFSGKVAMILMRFAKSLDSISLLLDFDEID
jgi:hypothetical protein